MSGNQRVAMWLPRLAGGAIGARKIVEPSADGAVTQANVNTDALLGVSGSEAVASGETVEVAVLGIVDVIAGGAITRGALVTTDANGDAVVANSTAHRVLGMAVESAAKGDWVPVLLSPGLHG